MDLLTIALIAALGAIVMGLLNRRRHTDSAGECGSAPSAEGCDACHIDCERSESTHARS